VIDGSNLKDRTDSRNGQLLIITIFKNNLSSLEATLQSISKLEGRVKLVLKNGGKPLSESQKAKVLSWVRSKNFETVLLEYCDDGVYSAMNQALELSASNGFLESVEWVWFLNSGDKLECNSHTNLMELQNVPKSSWMICGDPTVGLSMEFNETLRIDSYKFLDGSIIIGHQVALFRPEVFYEFGLYDEKKKIVSDYILMHKILGKSRLTKTSFPTIEYEDGGMSRVKLVTQEFEKIIYIWQVFKVTHDGKLIRILFYKITGVIKHIVKSIMKKLWAQVL
jgi:hypothetical protein